jgi:hypothetical protein
MDNTLAKSVFRFFRYENKGEPLLDNKTFKYKELFESKKIQEKDKHTLITSLEQVGKTFLTLPVSLIYLAFDISVVYLVMDKNQKRQVHRRLVSIMNDLYTYLQLQGFKDEDLDRFNSNNILYYDSTNKSKGNDLENALNARFKVHYQSDLVSTCSSLTDFCLT